MISPDSAPRKMPGRMVDYLSMVRLDHSTKHLFIVPGIVIAYLLRGRGVGGWFQGLVDWGPRVFWGLLAAVCIASANYVINEFLDREFDRFHPTKSRRACVQRDIDGRIVWLLWLVLVVGGLVAASRLGGVATLVAGVFALQGIVYNVAPLRTKDRTYWDVMSESINNPLRLLLGWAMIDGTTLAPASVILAYWSGGAFLMSAKRLSEYRDIISRSKKEILIKYRLSFAGYTERSLTVSCFVYGLFSTFFLAIFLVKYRIEYVLLMPVVVALFADYFYISMLPNSVAQSPERLFRERGLVFLVICLAVVFAATTVFDLPVLVRLTEQHYISLE